MPEASLGRSALEGRDREGRIGSDHGSEPGLILCERRDLDLVQLDLREADEAGRKAAEGAFGVSLPAEPCRSSRQDAKAALWTGPGRWLLLLPKGTAKETAEALRKALQGRHHALIELTQARTVIRAGGPAVRELLSKGGPIDLHPRVFPVGACAMTSLAHVTALIHHAEEDIFDLTVFRSFGLHLWEWLGDAGEEYNILVTPALEG